MSEKTTQELVDSLCANPDDSRTHSQMALNRRLFREMVKGEKEANMLTARRRKSLVKFAGHLKIDADEARLLIRGVEYECGDYQSLSEDGPGQDVEGAIRLVMIMLIVVVAGLVTQWAWSFLF